MEKASPTWLKFAGSAGGVVLGLVFLVAAWAKTLDPSAFAQEIEHQGLAILLPAMAVALIALALEVALGSALVLGVRRRWVLWPTAALVVFFLFLTGRAYLRYLGGEVPDEAGCGCFGNLVERTPTEAFWQDLLLMVPALLLAFLGRRGASHRLPVLRLVWVGLLTLATVVVAWKAPDLPLDNLATRVKPGTEILSLCAGSEEDGTRVCMDGVAPELGSGEHLVLLAELEDPALIANLDALNEYHLSGEAGMVWLLTGASDEQLAAFRFGYFPAFEIREAPAALLRPMYRTLPRSFRIRDGRVEETYSGLPSLGEIGAG